MKRFAEALTASQREQICRKKVVLWKKCNVLKKIIKRATQEKQAATLHVDMRRRCGAMVKHQIRNSTEAKMPWKSF